MSPPKVVRSAFALFFEYDTPRIAHIRSKKVGIINRLIQFIIIGYVVGYAIIYKKGYQDFENVQSAVTTKVKGIVFSNKSEIPSIGTRTWDVADYVIPPQESNAFFVMTNVLPTLMQSQKTCPEDPTVKDPDLGFINCTEDAQCEAMRGKIFTGGNGPLTGSCVPSDFKSFNETKVCQIRGWCPVENDEMLKELTAPILEGSRNFTVFIKNNIEFPKFDVVRRNIGKHYKTDTELSQCRWNASDPIAKFCPIFILDDIAKAAGVEYTNLTMEGGVMQIVIDWTCNLDIEDCVPSYSFRRLDKGDFKISKGFNFRYADKFMVPDENGTIVMHRNLYKAFGVRFIVTVQGKAGKFSIVPLILNLGSGLALLGMATVLCDIVVLYMLKARKFYWEKKYLDVKGQDAFEVSSNSSYEYEYTVLKEESEEERQGGSEGMTRRNLNMNRNESA